MKRMLLLLCMSGGPVFAQKKDTLLRYFDTKLQPVPRSEAVVTGKMYRSEGIWMLRLYYSNGKVARDIGYKDRWMNNRKGPYSVYDSLGTLVEKGNFRDQLLDGPLERWYENGKPQDRIEYTKGKKDGSARAWYTNGNPEYVGTHRQGDPHGVWTWYHSNGQPSTREEYWKGELVNLECFDSSGKSLGIMCSIQKDAVLLGDIPDFRSYVIEHLEWPKEALDNGMRGYVKVYFEVNEYGKLVNFSILQSSDPLFTAEVQKVFEGMPDWSPAISHNRPMISRWEMGIPFVPAQK